MNMNHSHKYPSRESSSSGFSRASVDSLAVFERPVARDWLLEGEMTSSGEPSYVFINTTPFQVGRRSSCNHTIPNRTVSGRHAELIVDNGNLLLKDHNSTNGTFLNGKRVRSFMPVADGDVIHFGKVRLRYPSTLCGSRLLSGSSMPALVCEETAGHRRAS
jgi:hypothetical protein